jgi:hypothetical protein
MVSCVRKSDLMISLIKDACHKIEVFTEETGQPLDWVHSGSLKIARRQQDGEVIELTSTADVAWGLMLSASLRSKRVVSIRS